MLLRFRRLLHSAPSKPLNLHKIPNSPQPRLLTPKIVDSVVANSPSDSIALSFFIWCARQPDFFHAPHSFDRMAPIVRRLTFRFKSVSGIIGELETIGCFTNAKIFLKLLEIYWRGDMFIFAHETFDEMLMRGFLPNTKARNMILDVLFKEGRLDAALRFFRETRMPNFISFSIVLRNLCECGDWLGVREVLREIVRRGFGLNASTFIIVLDFFKKAGKMREAFQALGLMIVMGIRPTVKIWSILIHGLCRADQVVLACKLLEKMNDSGCPPTVVTYTSVIKGLLEAGMSKEVVGIWDAMLSNDCHPDLVLYNVLIDSLSKAGMYEDGIKLFYGLQQRKMRPDSYTLSSLLPILSYSGEVKLLPELISELDSSVDLVIYNSLLNILCKGDVPYKAVEVYTDMIAQGLRPDGYSYVAVLSSLCKLGCINCAVRFYHLIAAKSHTDAYVHSSILDGLVKGRKYHLAIKLFREAVRENYSLDVVSYTTVIRGLFRVGRIEEACSLFTQMKLIGIRPNTFTYNVMLSGLCRSRNISAVNELLKEMEIDGIEKDISCNMLFNLLHGIGPVDLTPQLIDHLEDTNLSDGSGSDNVEFLVCSAT